MNQNDNSPKQQRKPRRRMSFKERQEQSLIDTLAEFHEKEDAKNANNNDVVGNTPTPKPIVEQKKRSSKPKPPKNVEKIPGSKTIVYIDGENTFFQLFDQLKRNRRVRYREDFVKFDLRGLLEEVLPEYETIGIKYYGSKLQEVDETPELLERTRRMIDHKNRWVGFLANQEVEFIDAGRLVIRNKGTRSEPDLTFIEKGIDVRLAVDIIDAVIEKHADTIVLWSSDSDLKPAVHAAEKHGTDVIYLTHENHINDVMAGSAKGVRTITTKQVLAAFERVNDEPA